MIEIKDLCVAFSKEYDVLHNINLNVEKGEKIALVGEKESGKTMLLRSIAKLEDIKSGEILIDKNDVHKIDFKKEFSVGFVPRKFVFMQNKTVKQNLEYVLKIRKVDSATINLKVLNALKNYDIYGIANFKIKELSAYQKTLVQLARVSLRKVELYLIDDITCDLLDSEAEKIVYKLKMLMNDNAESTFIFAFKNIAIAQYLGLKIIKLKDGSIQEDEEIDENNQ